MKGLERIVFVQSDNAPAHETSLKRAGTLARSLGVPLSRTSVEGSPPAGLGAASLMVAEADAAPGPWYRSGQARARGFVHHAPGSSWLLAPHGPQRARVVVAAVELPAPEPGEMDLAVVSMGDALARAEGARLLVVHGWSLIGESIVSCPVRGLGGARTRRILVRLRRERQGRLESLLLAACPDPGTRWMLAKGSAAQSVRTTLIRTGADALVMGYRGRSGPWGALRGNLAEDFVAIPGVSLMAVRPMEWPDARTTPTGER